MITDTDLTLFHKRYDAATRRAVWDAAYVASASCHRRAVVTLTGDGLQCADLTELRIPTGEVLSIANGDRAIFGHCEADEPPAGAMTVTSFSDNRRGSAGVRHWKVVCTG